MPQLGVSYTSSTVPGQFGSLRPTVETACHSSFPSFVYSTKIYEHLLCSRVENSPEQSRAAWNSPFLPPFLHSLYRRSQHHVSDLPNCPSLLNRAQTSRVQGVLSAFIAAAVYCQHTAGAQNVFRMTECMLPETSDLELNNLVSWSPPSRAPRTMRRLPLQSGPAVPSTSLPAPGPD